MDENKELTPAILIMNKSGKPERRMFFADHNDAWGVVKALGQQGWRGGMTTCEVYAQGETPDDVLLQTNMFDASRW